MTLTFGKLPESHLELRRGTEIFLPQPQMGCTNPACQDYGNLYSAERGDYFMAPNDRPVTCGACGGPYSLARVRTVIEFYEIS